MDIKKQFLKISAFLKKHQWVFQSEFLDRYPESFPEPYQSIAVEVSQLNLEERLLLENNLDLKTKNTEFKKLINEIKELSTIPQSVMSSQALNQFIKRKLSVKKVHELEVIQSYAKNLEWEKVFDFGGGAGHLCMSLVDDHHRAISFDSNKSFQESGKKKIQRWLPQLSDRIHFVHKELKSPEDIEHLIDEKTMMIGLHACGDLSSILCKAYQNQKAKYLLSYSCCYHKLTVKNYNLSKVAKDNPIFFTNHALTLAAKSYKKQTKETIKTRDRVKEYRYGLHFYLKNKYQQDFISLGNAHKEDYQNHFLDYAQKFSPIKIDLKDLDNFIKETYVQDKLWLMIKASSFRILFGRLIEIYLVLDRALALLEDGHHVRVYESFRRDLSPRNILLMASKDSLFSS
jgi:hypothetical protein